MDEFFYLFGAVVSVAWSLWLYNVWENRAGLPESSSLRFILLFLPATSFVLISVSGWSSISFLRIDIIGFVFFFFLIFITWLFQFLTLLFVSTTYKKLFIISLIIHQVVAAVIIIFVYFLKLYPIVGISISEFFASFKRFKGLNFIWNLLNPETNKQDAFSIMNKLFIALCTYLPLTLVRMWYTNRKFKQLKLEINELKLRIEKEEELTRNETSE